MDRHGKLAYGAVAAVIATLGAFSLYGFLHAVGNGTVDATVFVAMLALALVVFGIASGVVSEISGPGGWGAKLAKEAKAPVDPDVKIDDLTIVRKSDQDHLRRVLARIDRTKPVAIQLVVGPDENAVPPMYQVDVLDGYIAMLSQIDPNLTIVYVDYKGRFQGSGDALSIPVAARLAQKVSLEIHTLEGVAPHQAKSAPSPYLDMEGYVDLLKTGDLDQIGKFTLLTRNAVVKGTSNGAALAQMNADNVTSLVVVDDNNQPVGVLRQSRVMSRLMTALANG